MIGRLFHIRKILSKARRFLQDFYPRLRLQKVLPELKMWLDYNINMHIDASLNHICHG